MLFRYQVQAGDMDTDGISIAADALTLNGGSIVAAVDGTTRAVLTYAAVDADPRARWTAGRSRGRRRRWIGDRPLPRKSPCKSTRSAPRSA